MAKLVDEKTLLQSLYSAKSVPSQNIYGGNLDISTYNTDFYKTQASGANSSSSSGSNYTSSSNAGNSITTSQKSYYQALQEAYLKVLQDNYKNDYAAEIAKREKANPNDPSIDYLKYLRDEKNSSWQTYKQENPAQSIYDNYKSADNVKKTLSQVSTALGNINERRAAWKEKIAEALAEGRGLSTENSESLWNSISGLRESMANAGLAQSQQATGGSGANEAAAAYLNEQSKTNQKAIDKQVGAILQQGGQELYNLDQEEQELYDIAKKARALDQTNQAIAVQKVGDLQQSMVDNYGLPKNGVTGASASNTTLPELASLNKINDGKTELNKAKKAVQSLKQSSKTI